MAAIAVMVNPKKKKVEMVETEMGRMVPKAQQQAHERSMASDLAKAVPTPMARAAAQKEEEAEEMKKKAKYAATAAKAINGFTGAMKK